MTTPARSSEGAGATPRPWRFDTEAEERAGVHTALVIIPSAGPGRLRWTNAIYSDNAEADAALIAAAVNDYDRLKRIEEAARAVLAGWDDAAISVVEFPGLDAMDALRAALDQEAER